jgi:hypothetical protein
MVGLIAGLAEEFTWVVPSGPRLALGEEGESDDVGPVY